MGKTILITNENVHEMVLERCVHEWRAVLVKDEVERRHRIYVDEWGQEPPDGFIEQEVRGDWAMDDYWPKYCPKCGSRYTYNDRVLNYTGDLVDAFRVVRHLSNLDFDLNHMLENDGKWIASFGMDGMGWVHAEDNSPTMAICRAALMWVNRHE